MAILRIIIIMAVAFIATVSGHNITDILNQFPEYTEFNNYLTKTKLNDEINNRQTITVLVFNNTIVKEFLSNQPLSAVKVSLSIHVLLDYFDLKKLRMIGGGSMITTTLYQTTGNAEGNTGFVNITDLVSGKVAFGSGAGSRLDALFARSVKLIPYNISVLEIDSPIVAPGILNHAPPSRVNITSLLESAGCKMFARLISDTGVLKIYDMVQPRGLTVFAPMDSAFKNPKLPDLRKLKNNELNSLLLYHAIAGYVPKVSLMTETSPIRTLASNDVDAYLLKIRTVGDSVTLDSGIENSRVDSTVLDSVPISIFKIDSVLLPDGLFSKSPTPAPVPVPETSPPSPSPSAPAGRPIASSPAPVTTTTPVISPPASPTSSPGSAPAPAENPAADMGDGNASGANGGIKAPAVFLAVVTICFGYV